MCRGSGFRCSLTGGFPRHAFCILTPCTALTLLIQGKSRMRENRSCGFVRGANSDGRPYRDSHFFALTPVDLEEDLIQMPFVSGPGTASPYPCSVQVAALLTPAPNRFVADQYS